MVGVVPIARATFDRWGNVGWEGGAARGDHRHRVSARPGGKLRPSHDGPHRRGAAYPGPYV